MKDLGEMTPYELGETGEAEAIPYIIRYLETGRVGEKRLAASAIKRVCTTCQHFFYQKSRNRTRKFENSIWKFKNPKDATGQFLEKT